MGAVALFRTLIAATMLLEAPVAEESPPPSLSVSGSEWTVTHKNAVCFARPMSPKNPGSKIRYSSGPVVDWVAIQAVQEREPTPQYDGYASFELDDSLDGTFPYGTAYDAENSEWVTSVSVPRGSFEKFLKSGSARVHTDSGIEQNFVPPLPTVIAALEECGRGLMLSWGVPQSTLDAMATPPAFNANVFFNAEDYPASASRNGEEGKVGAVIEIGPNGRAKSCRVVESSGFPALDAKTCEVVLQRGRGRPARDEGGKPVEGATYFKVGWRQTVDQ